MNRSRKTIAIAIAIVCAVALATPWLADHFPTPTGADSTDPSENTAIIPAPNREPAFYDLQKRHEQVLRLIATRPVDLIFIGDSITHLFGGEPQAHVRRGAEVWEEYYGRRRALNLGFGWDRTQNVLWRIEQGELDGANPRVVVLLIGTNNLSETRHARSNTPVEIAAGVATICEAIRTRAPECHILLLGLLPRRSTATVGVIREVNALLARLDDEKHITFLDLTGRFAGKDGTARPELMHDDIHPGAAGYRVWAETMETVLREALIATAR